jgi:two-component system sensor histidine kinase KdpD
MTLGRFLGPRGPLIAVAGTAALLVATTLLIALLESRLGVPNASAVYLIAVVAVAVIFGTVPAMLAAVLAFLLYDFLFTEPLSTFTVANPGEWLNLLLLLLVGIVVGQLGAAERNRAEVAELRVREARALFQVSRSLATRDETISSLASIVDTLVRESAMTRVWVELGGDGPPGRIVADSGAGELPARPSAYSALARSPGDSPARWIRVHEPTGLVRDARRPGAFAFRVTIEASGRSQGALWGIRAVADRQPSREETRMLAASADQIGQALEQDRLRIQASSAELARRADAVKTALLDSVSHDLRTPLASIRAAAGSLMDPEVVWPAEERRAAAAGIDREAERLNRLVTNLLDLSRIEAGELRVEPETFPIEDLIQTSLRRLSAVIGGRPIEVTIEPNLPLVDVDAILFDQIVTNLIENAIAYVPEGAAIGIRVDRGSVAPVDTIRLIVEDGGAGVADADLGRLFDKFQRGETRSASPRRGIGIGLSIVRGFVEGMGGHVEARRSELGGLAIVIDLPSAGPRVESVPFPPASVPAADTADSDTVRIGHSR